MTRSVYVTGIDRGDGRQVVEPGVMELLTRQVDRVGVFRPLVHDGPDRLFELLRARYRLSQDPATVYGMDHHQASALQAERGTDELVSTLVDRFHAVARDCEVVLVVSCDFADTQLPDELSLNARLANEFGASVIPVVGGRDPVAPLHNPANLTGIRTARALRPDLPQVAVFDTSFHTTMPEYAASHALDLKIADRHRVRRYGFHGTSHAYVSRATAKLLGKAPEEVNVIVLHLGNGASASAVRGGRCVDTSMGLTPLEGLVMGTRSGDVDPAVIFHLMRVGGMSMDEIDTLLNKRSGLFGLCGDNDMREIRRRIDEGDRAARLAFDIYIHRLKKYIGAYYAVLGPGGRDRLHGRSGRERRRGAGGGRRGPGGAGPGGRRRPERRTGRRAAADLARARAGGGRRGAHRRGTGDRQADLRTGRKEQLKGIRPALA